LNHYQLLGVECTASPGEVRQAYRCAARQAHPDLRGEPSGERMAAINAAWHVLGDPVRRRSYDEMLAFAETTVAVFMQRSTPLVSEDEPQVRRHRKIGWGLVLLAQAAALVIAVLAIQWTLTRSSSADGKLVAGDCVRVTSGAPPVEVDCKHDHDAVVAAVVQFGHTCPEATTPYFSWEGRVCMVSVDSSTMQP
jgi:hypothetical protein